MLPELLFLSRRRGFPALPRALEELVAQRGNWLFLALTHGGLIRRRLVRSDVLARRFSLLSTGVSLGHA